MKGEQQRFLRLVLCKDCARERDRYIGMAAGRAATVARIEAGKRWDRLAVQRGEVP